MKLRRSGIEVVGDVPWSTHFCQFYQNKADLVELLVPYFKAGLEDNEFCMWITSEPLGVEEARQALEDAVPGLDTLLKKGQMEILSYQEWYLQGDDFNPEIVLEGWIDRLNQARIQGFDGLRLSGNTFWLEKDIWDDFIHYEDMINQFIGRYPMMALCTYSLDKCSASEILDVINTHEFTVARREGKWQIIQGVDHSPLDLQNKVEAAFSSINEAVITTDTEGNIIDMNEAFAHFHRFSSLDECSRHLDDYPHLFNVYWPDGTPAPADRWAVPRALEGEQASNIEYLIERTDTGEVWHSSYSFAPIRNMEGEISGTVVIMRDTTHTKQRELELKWVNERLNIASRAAGAGIWDWNIETGEIEWSPLMFELLGLDPHTKVSFPLWESVIHPEDLEKAGERIREAITNHTFLDNLYRIIKPNGEVRWINALGQTEYDQEGRPLWMTGICLDITERQETEIRLEETLNTLEKLVQERTQELKISNTYNRNLIETALDPLVTIGADGKITDVNKATEQATGCSREELIGTDFARYFTQPEEAERGYQHVFQEGEVKDYPLEIKHQDGTITPVLYNAAVYRDEQQKVVGIFAAARDITERKQAEEELRIYWESLEEQVRLRTEELARSNADLQQFAYIASHDLREPLRMITNFLQLLERRYQDQLDQDAQEFIYYAVDGAKRLDQMIISLLEYSQVANQDIQTRELDLGEVLEQVQINLDVFIQENQAQIEYSTLPTLQADENQMVRLFQNLISNSIKYRREEPPRIDIQAQDDGDQVVFSVQDNGIGIDPQHLESIFTIFSRLHNHDQYQGTGMGLAIAQRIVHQHGGEIWAESEGEGSTFYFTMPK